MQRNNREELFIWPKEKWYQLVSKSIKKQRLVLSGDAHVYDTVLDVLIGIYMVALKVKTQQYQEKRGGTNNQVAHLKECQSILTIQGIKSLLKENVKKID